MLRVLDIPPDGEPTLSGELERVGPPREGWIRWVDLDNTGHEELALLGERFGFHPLALEDSAHFGQRPKLEDFDDHLFLVTHGFAVAPAALAELHDFELHAFLGRGYLVTVHNEPLDALDAVFLKAYSNPSAGRRGADFLYYLVLDGVVDACFPTLDRITDRLEELEKLVLGEGTGHRADIAEIFELKRALASMRRVLSPQRDVVGVLARDHEPLVSARTALYYRDVYDHLIRAAEAIDAARDLVGSTLDAHLSMASNRTNEIMKRLTLMSAIFLPLTFLTGFFGQNFAKLPYESERWLEFMLLGCTLIPSGMIVWFHRRKWL